MKRLAEDYTRSHEPIAWSLFGAGGMVVAFITPVLILISALLVPLGLADSSLLSYANLLDLLNTGWGALAIFIVIALQLFHAAHRIYHGATWFKLAPKIMVVRLGDWKLPERLMVVGQWIGLILISVILLTVTLMAGA
jgi:fumarate reductase subunit D